MAQAFAAAEALVCMLRGDDEKEYDGWFPDAFRVGRLGLDRN